MVVRPSNLNDWQRNLAKLGIEWKERLVDFARGQAPETESYRLLLLASPVATRGFRLARPIRRNQEHGVLPPDERSVFGLGEVNYCLKRILPGGVAESCSTDKRENGLQRPGMRDWALTRPRMPGPGAWSIERFRNAHPVAHIRPSQARHTCVLEPRTAGGA